MRPFSGGSRVRAGYKDEEEEIRGADFFRVDHRSVLEHHQIQEDPCADYERRKEPLWMVNKKDQSQPTGGAVV